MQDSEMTFSQRIKPYLLTPFKFGLIVYFSVYAESVHCLTDNIHCYIHGSVPRSVTEPHELLLHMLQASEIISSNVTCMDINAVTDFNKYFGGCMGKKLIFIFWLLFSQQQKDP